MVLLIQQSKTLSVVNADTHVRSIRNQGSPLQTVHVQLRISIETAWFSVDLITSHEREREREKVTR